MFKQTCFEGLDSICICPWFAEYGFLYLCLTQAVIFFLFLSLCEAPTDFSTWELSPPLRNWHAPRSWRGWLASGDENERSPVRLSDVTNMGVVVFFCFFFCSVSAERERGRRRKWRFDYNTQHAARHSCQQLYDLPWKRRKTLCSHTSSVRVKANNLCSFSSCSVSIMRYR